MRPTLLSFEKPMMQSLMSVYKVERGSLKVAIFGEIRHDHKLTFRKFNSANQFANNYAENHLLLLRDSRQQISQLLMPPLWGHCFIANPS